MELAVATRGCSRATWPPAGEAWPAVSPTAAVSRVVAPLARMVRTADSARSSAAVMAPTASCACRDSRRTPRETLIATVIPMPTATTVTSRSQTSTSTMAIRAPTAMTTDPAISTTPDVTVARSSVVSAPTRDIRSPVRRRSYSATGSRSSRSASLLRVLRTTPSAVFCRTNCCAAPRKAPATSTTTSPATAGTSDRPAPTASMTRATRAGWARAATAPTSDRPAARASARLCGRSRGSSSRSPAGGGAAGADRPSFSQPSVSRPAASVAGGERADDRGQQPGVVLDQQRAVPVGTDGGDEVPRPAFPAHGSRPELVAVVGAQQQALNGGVLGHAAHLWPVLGDQQLPAGVERLVPAGHRHQTPGPVLPQPRRGQPERRHRAEQRGRGDRVLGDPLPAPRIDHVEGDELHRTGSAAEHAGGARLLAGAHRSGLEQARQDGVLRAAAVGDRPAVLQRPALRPQLVALIGERPLHLRVAGAPGPEHPAARPFRGRGRRRRRVCRGRLVAVGRGSRQVPARRFPRGPAGGRAGGPGLRTVGVVPAEVGGFLPGAPCVVVVETVTVARGAHRCLSVMARARPGPGPIRTCRAVPARAPSAGPSSSWGPSVRQRATGSRRPRPLGRAAGRGSRGPAAGAGWPRPSTPRPPAARPR